MSTLPKIVQEHFDEKPYLEHIKKSMPGLTRAQYQDIFLMLKTYLRWAYNTGAAEILQTASGEPFSGAGIEFIINTFRIDFSNRLSKGTRNDHLLGVLDPSENSIMDAYSQGGLSAQGYLYQRGSGKIN
jgi:hypothetical protein